jgi:hypothetical protein
MKNIKDSLQNSISERDYLSKTILNDFKLNNSNIILYPLFENDKISLKEILTIYRNEDKLSIETNNEIVKIVDFIELVLFMKEVEEFLLLEDSEIIKKRLEVFNTKYMTIIFPILDMIFEIDGDLKILGAKIDFDSFMSHYRYEAMKHGLSYLSKTILATVPKDTKKIYLATTSGLNKMSSCEI